MCSSAHGHGKHLYQFVLCMCGSAHVHLFQFIQRTCGSAYVQKTPLKVHFVYVQQLTYVGNNLSRSFCLRAEVHILHVWNTPKSTFCVCAVVHMCMGHPDQLILCMCISAHVRGTPSSVHLEYVRQCTCSGNTPISSFCVCALMHICGKHPQKFILGTCSSAHGRQTSLSVHFVQQCM